jgi:3'-5' exonuclease
MVNRVPAAGLQVQQYFHRYTEDALDLCDVLGSYVHGAKGKLDDESKILGLSGKPVRLDGSDVEEIVLAGPIEEVARYCESDVLNTYRVWLVYELFRGSVAAQELNWSEAQIYDLLPIVRRAIHICVPR